MVQVSRLQLLIAVFNLIDLSVEEQVHANHLHDDFSINLQKMVWEELLRFVMILNPQQQVSSFLMD